MQTTGTLVLANNQTLSGFSFGAPLSKAGEVVFTTGMVGYPEAFTDPSFAGQILVMTYPLLGNYGVPPRKEWERSKVQIAGLIVSSYVDTPSHPTSKKTLAAWLTASKVPALEIKDTRLLAQLLREKGALLGKIIIDKDVPFYDPNTDNVVAKASIKTPQTIGHGNKKIILIDCGAKRNIVRCLTKRNAQVMITPWDYDFVAKGVSFDGVIISNGPGDPKQATKTIAIIQKLLQKNVPILGICLGNQLLALAAGGDTYKLKFGHRSQNQPCMLAGTNRCYITTQNHGFAVGKIPHEFEAWFTNANDGTNEGIKHKTLPIMSVQFHPEANPGPQDTEWIFDHFLEKL